MDKTKPALLPTSRQQELRRHETCYLVPSGLHLEGKFRGAGSAGGGGVCGACSRLVLVLERLVPGFVEETRAHQRLCHGVGVAVGRGPAVLEVALLLVAHVARDADAGAAVGHAGRELVDVGRLVEARQAPGIVQPSLGVVGTDVVLVALAQLLDGLLDVPAEGGRDTAVEQ